MLDVLCHPKFLTQHCQNEKPRCLDRVDFITKALEKRGRVETERILASFEELDSSKNGNVSLQVSERLARVLMSFDGISRNPMFFSNRCTETWRET